MDFNLARLPLRDNLRKTGNQRCNKNFLRRNESQHFISYDNVRTSFLTCAMLTLYFFPVFFSHNNFKAYLEKYKFWLSCNFCGHSRSTSGINHYLFSSLYSAKLTLSIAFSLNPLKTISWKIPTLSPTLLLIRIT